MRLWLIPMIYVIGAVICGFAVPRLEQAYLPDLTFSISVASAQAYLSAIASGTMALMSIVFAMAFVMVQFNAIAYSPRLVTWMSNDSSLFHSLGVFAATFIYALVTLTWVDRGGSGSVPLISAGIVAFLLIVSMLLFSRLVQRLSDLQITSILTMVGDKGRATIESMFPILNDPARPASDERGLPHLGKAVQSLHYTGPPMAVARFDLASLVRLAEDADGVVVLACAVGDTMVDGSPLMTLHASKKEVPHSQLLRAIRLERERTFEQDPKYPLRLLVDIAIKALSAAINDPTTATQTIDQIEDLLRRLGRRQLDTGRVRDQTGTLRVVFPTPSWEDYLSLAFDEIRQYGGDSVQVVRRLRAALSGLISSLSDQQRIAAVERYVQHLDLAVAHSSLDSADRIMAHEEDRQGLGLTRKPVAED